MDCPLPTLLDAFADALQGELERQHDILTLCRAQREAMVARDVEHIEAHTTAIETLLREAARDFVERHRALELIARATRASAPLTTLSGLIAVVDEPWKARLADLRARLKDTLAQTRMEVRNNARIARRAQRLVSQCLTTLGQSTASACAGAYGAKGLETRPAMREPALVDRRG